VTGDGVLLLFMPVANALSAGSSATFSFGMVDAARYAKIFKQVVEPRLLLAGDLAAARQRVDHRLVKPLGDENPEHRADRGPRQRGRWHRARRGA